MAVHAHSNRAEEVQQRMLFSLILIVSVNVGRRFICLQRNYCICGCPLKVWLLTQQCRSFSLSEENRISNWIAEAASDNEVWDDVGDTLLAEMDRPSLEEAP